MVKKSSPADAFESTVRDALKHYSDSEWLGNHSPLAAPYFLGRFLGQVERPQTTVGRGEALRLVLFKAAEDLWPGVMPQSRGGLLAAVEEERAQIGNGGPRYLFLVLDLRYFRYYFSPRTAPNVGSAIYDYLTISESAFFRHLAQAINTLVAALLEKIRPNLRLEQPILNEALIGRDSLIADCLNDLKLQQSVALSGLGGIGKTSLGTAVKQQWISDITFWYTIRPGLNDDLTSLLFSLGHFLRTWDRPSLWLHLVANDGVVDSVQQAIGFLGDDLSMLGRAPLLCFDEVDLLHTGSSQSRHGAHKQLLELFEGLKSICSVIFIGQRALIDTDVHYALQPLGVDDIRQLLVQREKDISRFSAERIYKYTLGNPRLIELYLAGGEVDKHPLQRGASIRPLFNRLWKRLEQSEKQVLAGLSVYRSFAPEDAWENEPGVTALRRRFLVKSDAQGGIALLPFFRELTYEEFDQEQRERLHQNAAMVRATRGQYTEAAYHFVKAGDIGAAVTVWYPHQDIEIQQGNAGSAYAVFKELKRQKLDERTAKRLKLIQNRLHLLHGQLEDVLADMDSYSWQPDEEISADAYYQWGEALWQTGDSFDALEKLDDAVDVLVRISSRITQNLRLRGVIYTGLTSLEAADREVKLAEYEIDRLRAIIEIGRGDFAKTREYFQHGLLLAQEAGDEKREAVANSFLSAAAGNLGDLSAAKSHADAAMKYYQRVGDIVSLEAVRAEMAGFYLNVRQFNQAIELGEPALRFFERIKHENRVMYLSSNLAEAYFETGDLEKAEQYALRARDFENPRIQPYVNYTLGLIYQAKDDPHTARSSFQNGIEIAEKNGDRFVTAYLYRAYGLFLRSEGKTAEGQALLQEAYTQFLDLNISYEAEQTRHYLADQSY